MKAYLIGGLAADGRVFRHIRLPERYETVFLDWIIPEPGESLRSYALRMAEQMDQREEYVIVGVSFGGILAREISRRYPARKTILIASVPHHGHLPKYYRWMHRAGMARLVPISLIKKAVMLNRYFTSETEEDRNIVRSMVRAADDRFIRWAILAALEWEAEDEVDCIHIHGSRDIVFPIRYTSPSHTIRSAGHLMVMENAADINRILEEIL